MWSSLEMAPDPHATTFGDKYHTATLYFDTDEFDMFFRRGSQARAKFRIRAYNDGPLIFLERKLRTGDRVSKRRTPALLADLPRIIGNSEDWCGRWFVRRLRHRGLRPVCQVDYTRTARIAESPAGMLRLTIDQNITAVSVDRISFSDAAGIEIIPGNAVLELKYAGEIPAFFEKIMKKFNLHPQSVSKYRLSLRTLGIANDKERMLLHA